jgi:hypothetical protein
LASGGRDGHYFRDRDDHGGKADPGRGYRPRCEYGAGAGQAPFDRQYASKSDGTFLFSNVPAGKYQICVEAPHENVLDPCLWSPTVNVVDISNGAPVSGLAVQVATGYMLQVHVNDPAALLPAAVGGTAGPALSVVAITQTK